MTKVDLKGVHSFIDRHGKTHRNYYRPPGGGKQVALPSGDRNSEEVLTAYLMARAAATRVEIGASRTKTGTVDAAIVAYYGHSSFLAFAEQTRKSRRAIFERFRADNGDKRIATMQREHVAKLIGQKSPQAMKNWLKALRGLMQFAVLTGLRSDDPTADLKAPRARVGTIHSWTEEEIARFETHHPVGSRPRLAVALALYTAARRGDLIGLGPQHVRNGMLTYRQNKTGRSLDIPVHPDLATILAASPKGHLTFLVTGAGAPFSAAGIGNAFRRWCTEAGLSHCSAHGLRKAQARRLAEAGCSAHEIASITGHKTLAEVQRYADAANQARMARAAMATVSAAFPTTEAGTPIGKPRQS